MSVRPITYLQVVRLVAALMAVSLAVMLSGCGGGSGSTVGSGNQGSTGGQGGSGSQGGAGAGTPADQQRTAAFAAISAAYSGMPHKDAAADAQALAAFIRTRSEFAAAGVAKGIYLWANFKDGRMVAIDLFDAPPAGAKSVPAVAHEIQPVNGPLQLGQQTSDVRTATESGGSNSRGIQRVSEVGIAQELPVGTSVLHVNADLLDVPASAGSPFQASNAGFQAIDLTGYSVNPVDGTIDTLKQKSLISTAGVLYIQGSGVIGHRGASAAGGLTYGMGTRTAQSPGADAANSQDLDAGRIGYLLKRTRQYSLIGSYFITDLFVQRYWQFSPNTLVINGTSLGNAAEAAAFRQACFANSASVYFGWDGIVVPQDSDDSALFLIDRLSGSNGQTTALQQETPFQRPFNYFSITGDMKTRYRKDRSGYNTGSTYLFSNVIPGSYGSTAATVASSNFLDNSNPISAKANFGILNPTVGGAAVDEGKHDLIIDGIFGAAPPADQQTVSVDGINLANNCTWKPNQIIVHSIPSSGRASHGDVFVSVGRRKSNTVQITDWRGTFTFTQVYNRDLTDANPTRVILTLNAHLRASYNETRVTPGTRPLNLSDAPGFGSYGLSFGLVDDSTCTLAAKGVFDAQNYRTTYSDPANTSVTLSKFLPHNDIRFRTYVDLHSPVSLAVHAAGLVDAKATTFDKLAGSTSVTTEQLPFDSEPDFNPSNPKALIVLVTGASGSRFDFQAGKLVNISFTGSVSWNDFPANDPPKLTDDTQSRVVSRPRRHAVRDN